MGPLQGLKVLEMAGIGPGPFCAMMLADMGAEVVRIDRLNQKGTGHRANVLNRGRRSIALDLKNPAAVETVLRMIEDADALIEGFRPGVMERLGLGPDVCLERNPKLIFGRMTGWGQSGPLAQAAGHDINY
ncbi:MAG: alpha-methylacyl-CoA racemase, partial [Pseudohongiellaceae bacterium]